MNQRSNIMQTLLVYENNNKSETELTAGVLKKKSKNRQKVQQNAFHSDKTRPKPLLFEGILFSKTTSNVETNKSLSWSQLATY